MLIGAFVRFTVLNALQLQLCGVGCVGCRPLVRARLRLPAEALHPRCKCVRKHGALGEYVRKIDAFVIRTGQRLARSGLREFSHLDFRDLGHIQFVDRKRLGLVHDLKDVIARIVFVHLFQAGALGDLVAPEPAARTRRNRSVVEPKYPVLTGLERLFAN